MTSVVAMNAILEKASSLYDTATPNLLLIVELVQVYADCQQGQGLPVHGDVRFTRRTGQRQL